MIPFGNLKMRCLLCTRKLNNIMRLILLGNNTEFSVFTSKPKQVITKNSF